MAKKNKFTDEDDALLSALGVEIEVNEKGSQTSREERIIAGFEEIQKFFEKHGRLPEHGENKDIFERLYAIRLDQIHKQEECRNLLKKIDHQGLLIMNGMPEPHIADEMNDNELLEHLGVDEIGENSITNLRHVKSGAEKKAAEEIANRTRCEDFERFKTFFDKIKKEIEIGHRTTVNFRKDAGFSKTTLKKYQFIIIGGLFAYIAEYGETFKAPNGEDDARLRVIFANGTESNILLRSLIRAMYKDETSRFITEPELGPLFSSENIDDDVDSGTIYVLQSHSDHPVVEKNRAIVHKIGVTGGDVKKRISNAKNDPTFLLADVEIVATYKLANINRTKLEKIIHRFFGSVNLEIGLNDRFGNPVTSKEWFLVPIFIIDEMVEKIKDGTVSDYYYDATSAKIQKY